MSRRIVGGACVVGACLMGCASAKTAPSAPGSTYEDSPSADEPSVGQPPADPSTEELRLSEHEDEDPSLALDHAESELDRILAEDRGYATPPPQAPPGGDEVTPPTKRPGVSLGVDPCHAACRALASMRRATDHLCALSGEEETRCGDARGRVQRAERRVQTRCPACAD